MERGIGAWIGRRPRVYRWARALVSPLHPGRGGYRLLRRMPGRRRVLNVGSGPLVYGPDIINIDARAHPEVRVVADAKALPIREGSIDGVICEVMLEHVPDPQQAVHEMIRCLRPGGWIYISAPFLQPFHCAPTDYTRWTLPGLERLVGRGVRIVESGVAGGPTAAVTWILSEYIGLVLSFGSVRVQAAVALALRVILSPLKALDLLLMRMGASSILASLLFVLARKPDSK
ncbi:MAG: class I SAM-dependent methyltransferase [Planctomycetota bacterium]|nr:class I SAM-dependent methyltransferase [Planctomycetota bacterium]